MQGACECEWYCSLHEDGAGRPPTAARRLAICLTSSAWGMVVRWARSSSRLAVRAVAVGHVPSMTFSRSSSCTSPICVSYREPTLEEALLEVEEDRETGGEAREGVIVGVVEVVMCEEGGTCDSGTAARTELPGGEEPFVGGTAPGGRDLRKEARV